MSDRQSGFSMFLKYFIRPKLQQQSAERIKTVDLINFGQPYWEKLSCEAKEEWNKRAKEYNKSEARLNRRLECCRRKHLADERMVFARSHTFRKLKPSKIMPSSGRYDEVDQYSRKYFAGIDDDFEGKRENDRRDFIDRYQWKFARKEQESKKDFFYESEIIVVMANVYYEDSYNERMIPSEISVLKFSIKHGIYDHRHYILGFAKNGIVHENSKTEAEENEQITGLLMDSDKMSANVRFDYTQIWNEIKAFTKIDGHGMKILLLSKDWNTVVGSFDALFVHANEKSFSRIETRFATLEDYFMAIYATVHDVSVSDEIKSDVATEMNEPWHHAVFFDSITCDFHSELKYTEQCQAKSCSLFAAHKAVFNFFMLCKKYVFPDFEFTERHMPNKASLLAAGDNLLECTLQRSSNNMANYTLVENIPEQSSVSLLLPKDETLKSIVKKETSSVYEIESAKHLERKTSVERWLQTQGPLSHTKKREMRFCSRNPHISLDFPIDMVTDQQLCSSSQFVTVPAYQLCQKTPSYFSEKSKSDFSEIHVTKNQLPLNYQFSKSGTELSSVVINGDIKERDEIPADLNIIDNDSDTEMFCDVSIPSSSLYGQDFLKASNKMRKISGLSPKEVEATHGDVKSVQNPCHNRLVATSSTYPVSLKSNKVLVSEVNQDKFASSRRESIECRPNLSLYSQKMSKSPLSDDNLIPERTSGGFCIPNVCETNHLRMRKNWPGMSASTREIGNWQRNMHERSEMITNQTVTPVNQHASSQNLAQSEQKGRKLEASSKKLQEQSSPSPVQSAVNGTVGYKCMNQEANIMKPFILEPLICKEAEMFGWSESVQSSSSSQNFIYWLKSAYFES
ncbi:Protein maelstrom [Dirofilaria immitis]